MFKIESFSYSRVMTKYIHYMPADPCKYLDIALMVTGHLELFYGCPNLKNCVVVNIIKII